jgi:predicted TIM-barrel fold metal-dependent hydrolase
MIIDAHTHLFPPGVVLDREGHRARDIWFGEAFASPKAIFVTPEELLASMDGAGIEYSVVVGWPWRDPGLCAEHNAYLAEVSAQSGGRLQWMAIVNPTSRNSRNQVIDASAAGAVAIGELNADGQDFDWRDVGVLEPFVESCLEVGLPIMMHCSESVGHLYPGKGSATPEKIVPFAEAYPELKIIAAHWGGGLPYYELMPEVRRALQNVVYDSAASTYLYDFAIFDAVTRIAGADRVLFASDFPVLKQKRFLDRVRMTGLDDETMKKVLGGNAQRVFGLEEEE